MQATVTRSALRARIDTALARSRIVLLVGPRQAGKTTIARTLVNVDSPNYFDLEDVDGASRLANPSTTLAGLTGLVVIDEVQRQPELFPLLRVLADRDPLPARFLLLGSAAPEALRHTSESLAGRVETIEVTGFDVGEVGLDTRDQLWLRGGLPPSFLAASDTDSRVWRQQYLRAVATRDLPFLGAGLAPATIERYLGLVAHQHGQLWNAAAPARALGIAETTARKYLDVLADAMLVRVLPAWSGNLGKRLVKSPKVYFRDTGVLHTLTGIGDHAHLQAATMLGPSWEGFVLEHVLARSTTFVSPHFWRTSNGAELDLLLPDPAGAIGVEIKYNDAPSITRSMRTAVTELALHKLYVIYPGERRWHLDEKIEAVGFAHIDDLELPQ